ncbi:MAG: MFS transporter [Alphaproteobacteria bacterium]|nr:MFS transporter [Alphaproteobacteria bacterium]
MRRAIITLGIAQTFAWGGSYYLPAILVRPMAQELGLSVPMIFGIISAALLASAFLGPATGRWIDRHGGRGIMMLGVAALSAGVALMGLAQGFWTLSLAWAVIAFGMGIGLYEPAFAALTRIYGKDARSAITGITLIAGFASTLSWPLTTWMEAQWGWRGACFAWAVLLPAVCLPMLALLPRAPAEVPGAPPAGTPAGPPPSPRVMALLVFIFAVSGFGASAMAAHMPAMLTAMGAGTAAVLAAGALLGPAQVAARVLDFAFLRKLHPLVSTTIANLLHPIGAVMLMAFNLPAAFAILHGAGNGMLTISRGTLPLALFGPAGYGARTGWLVIPTRIAGSSAPLLFGLMLEYAGSHVLWFTLVMHLMAAAALLVLTRITRSSV